MSTADVQATRCKRQISTNIDSTDVVRTFYSKDAVRTFLAILNRFGLTTSIKAAMGWGAVRGETSYVQPDIRAQIR